MKGMADAIKQLRERLEPLGIPVYHFKGELDAMPIAVFIDTGENYEFADNEIVDTTLLFDFTYLTKKDDYRDKEIIKRVLTEIGASFQYRCTYNYDADTILHIFVCEILI